MLSQIIIGVESLETAADRFRAMGFDVLDGGVHPGFGTANRVIPLGAQYIELLGIVSSPEARQNEYGRSLLRAIAEGDRLVRWSIRTDEIDEVASRLGISVERRRRQRPDGELLTWRAAGLDLALADPTLPFFMQWDRPDQYPGAMPAAHENGARGVTRLVVTPRDAVRFRVWTAGADVPLQVVDRTATDLWSVVVATDEGELIVSG
jgi:Glyoxalase-like domain